MRQRQSTSSISRRSILAMGAVAALPLAEARAAEGGTIRVSFPVPVATLDPAKFRVGGLEYNYANCVFNRLTMQDAKLAVQPDLASSWESSEDLKVWTFHLRPNVTFHEARNSPRPTCCSPMR